MASGAALPAWGMRKRQGYRAQENRFAASARAVISGPYALSRQRLPLAAVYPHPHRQCRLQDRAAAPEK